MIETVKIEGKNKTGEGNLLELYERTFPYVAKFVQNMGGSFDDARDIFHDALVVYSELKPEIVYASENAYILGIAKHLWVKKYNRTKSTVSFTEIEKQVQIPDDYYPTVNNKRLLRFLEATGKKCMDLLRAFYFQKTQLKSIVRMHGYSNEHSASVQKYKCLEKVRLIVKEKSLAYEDFVE